MTKDSFVILPYWVEAALRRNGCDLDVCLDFPQVRAVLSLEDMSGLLALQDIPAVTREEGDLSRTLLTNWYETAKGPQRVELESTIIPLARSNELKEEIQKRLDVEGNQPNPYNQNTSTLESTYYRVVDLNRKASALVVYGGFPSFVSKPENEFKVVVEQLKTFYVYLKLHQVSLLPVFRRYLKLLEVRSNPISTL